MKPRDIAKYLDRWVQRRDSWAKELELVKARKLTAERYEDRCAKALTDAEDKIREWKERYVMALSNPRQKSPIRGLEGPPRVFHDKDEH
jgi:hypothetical protein